MSLRRAILSCTIAASVFATGCTHAQRRVEAHPISARHADDLSHVVKCGWKAGSARRWRMFVYRLDKASYLYFEQEGRQVDGSWRSLGGVGYDPSKGAGGPRRLRDMHCSRDGEGLNVTAHEQDASGEVHFLEISVGADNTLEAGTIVHS